MDSNNDRFADIDGSIIGDAVVHICVIICMNTSTCMFSVHRRKFNMYQLYLAYISVLYHTYMQDTAK